MKKILPLFTAACVLAFLPSCRFIRISDEIKEEIKNNGVSWVGEGSGEQISASDNIITRNDVTGDFHALTCNLPGDVIYTPGECALTISGPDNVLEHIKVGNDNGVLTVTSDGARFRKLRKLTIHVSSPVMEEMVFNGAVDFKAPQGITALDFKLTVNGAGDIEISGLKADSASVQVNGAGDATVSKLDCEALTVAIAGAGDAVVSGRAGRADLSISGAGDIDAVELKCEDISTKVRGVGTIKRP